MKEITTTAKYLAHDVSFKVLKIGNQLLQETNNKKEIQSVLDTLIPNLNNATSEVEATLENILTISSPLQLKKQTIQQKL